jgi:hypothetical protein
MAPFRLAHRAAWFGQINVQRRHGFSSLPNVQFLHMMRELRSRDFSPFTDD